MSVCRHAYLKNHMPRLREIFMCMLPVAVARSSTDDDAIRYVLPVFWMTPCLPIIGQARTTPIGSIFTVTHR